MLRAVLDLVSRREVGGQVVRGRSYRRGNDRVDHCMAVDSGRSDKVKAWLVQAAVYDRFRGRGGQGDRRSAAGARLPGRARQRGPAPTSTGPEPEEQPAGNGPGPSTRPPPGPRPGRAGGHAGRPGGRGRPGHGREDRPGALVGLLARMNQRFGDTARGVGDEAFLRADTIAVIAGDVAVSIRLQGDGVADRPEALRRRPRPRPGVWEAAPPGAGWWPGRSERLTNSAWADARVELSGPRTANGRVRRCGTMQR